MPTRCNRGFYCRSYCSLNMMFRAPLCPSSGAQDYYTVVAACGISCCGFQVVGLMWSWGLCVRWPQGSPRTSATCIAATTPGLIIRILNSVFFKIFKFLNYLVTLTRYRPTPWWWSVKIETRLSTFKYFYVF